MAFFLQRSPNHHGLGCMVVSEMLVWVGMVSGAGSGRSRFLSFPGFGVTGIGDVHAVRLITEYGSLENLLQNADKVQPEHIREALLKNKDMANLSKDLVMLRCDLPLYMVPIATEDLEFNYPVDNGEKFTSLLTAIGAYAEGFSADPIIKRALYLWKNLAKQKN